MATERGSRCGSAEVRVREPRRCRRPLAASARRNPGDPKVPLDLVTASGSGLDPDITPEAAHFQAARVAAARGVPVDQVARRIDARVDRSGAILGASPRVNVLLLNLDLDEAAPAPLAPRSLKGRRDGPSSGR